ncbi:acyltransferase family protein [Mycetocola reblochoni]|uniref:Mll2248 protein n=1 Tax=Mycetocola reblochoni REB411 TaxID=1255698 RepID=A0A1R4I825_9MICO|nr:acyltransferase family protein [Mycetocola reblochoni]SJN16021.1 Mll2248 protein [Mycetocola reblochoni REB411]
MSTTAGGREQWIDTARAVAIVLVVLFHAVIFLDVVQAAGAWPRVNNLLDSFRMPLFFTLSGILAVSSMGRPLRVVWARRAAPLLYLYPLWCLIQHAVGWTLGPPVGSEPSVGGLLRLLVLPDENLWFILALPLYVLAHRAVVSAPTWLVLTTSATVSLVVPLLLPEAAEAWVKPSRYLVFFTLGLVFSGRIRRAAGRVRTGGAVIAIGAFVAGSLAVRSLAGALGDGAAATVLVPTARTLLGVVAVAAGIAAAVLLSRHGGRIATRVAALGRRTLPVYLLHTIPLMLGAAVLGSLWPHGAPLGSLWPPVAAAAAIALSLLVHRATARIPGLYSLDGLPSRTGRRAVAS